MITLGPPDNVRQSQVICPSKVSCLQPSSICDLDSPPPRKVTTPDLLNWSRGPELASSWRARALSVQDRRMCFLPPLMSQLCEERTLRFNFKCGKETDERGRSAETALPRKAGDRHPVMMCGRETHETNETSVHLQTESMNRQVACVWRQGQDHFSVSRDVL